MSVGGGDTTWVGKKPLRRVGGLSDARSIAADLGFSVPSPPSQEDMLNLSTGSGENGDDLIRILRELSAVHRKITDLEVELQGRKKQLSELLVKAASDYGALTASAADFQWTQYFKEHPQ